MQHKYHTSLHDVGWELKITWKDIKNFRKRKENKGIKFYSFVGMFIAIGYEIGGNIKTLCENVEI